MRVASRRAEPARAHLGPGRGAIVGPMVRARSIASRPRRTGALVGVISLGVVACDAPAPTSPDADLDGCVPHTAAGPLALAPVAGEFHLRASPPWAIFQGRLLAAPPLDFHVEAERAGACRLLTYAATSCDPACADGAICLDGACLTPPPAVDAGTLTLAGDALPTTELPAGDGGYYWGEEIGEVTGRVTLTGSAGGALAGVELAACAPPPLVATSDWGALMEARAAGADVTLAWAEPVAYARVYLRMTTGIGTHGGISPVEIECEGPDTGSLTLPGAYLDALFAQGWSCGECGSFEVVRYVAAESSGVVGTARLRVETAAPFYFHP
jgi:hypothetical protein